jgi:SAM-dependent methyltransferase
MQNMPDLDYVSADLESSLAMVKMGLSDIQFPDARFNVVLCSNALENIPDDKDSIQEMYRVLKPGSGYAVLLIPPLEGHENHAAKENDPWENASHLMHRLSDVGFEVGTVRLYDDLGAELASFLGIKDQIIIESHKKDFSCQMKFSRRLSLSGRLKLFFRG